MKNFLKQYFIFNNRQRNGIIVLLAIIVLLIISIQLTPYLIKQPNVEFGSLKKQIDQFPKTETADTSEEIAQSSIEYELSSTAIPEKKTELFNFNPNTATADELKQLGFSDKLIHTLANYRNKGGHFYKKEDLKKIYGLKEKLYQSLEPYITLEVRNQVPALPPEKRLVGEGRMELNSTDSLSLIQLKGIGPAFAHRIITYRNKLGGYNNIEQLKEVYGLDSSMFMLVSPQFDLNNNTLTKININVASVDELKKHPYIKYQIANLIVNYRNQHGPYKSVDEIKKLRLLTEELYIKLVPYLKTE